jgi:hypothetical protein
LEQLISQAKTVAQNAANQTPGVRRCSSWSGYGEKGSECAYAFVDPDQVVEGVESSESTDAVDPPTLESPALVTASSIKILSKSKLTTTVKSLSPKICKVSKLKITKLKKGTCNYSVTTKAKNGKKATSKKAVMFIN